MPSKLRALEVRLRTEGAQRAGRVLVGAATVVVVVVVRVIVGGGAVAVAVIVLVGLLVRNLGCRGTLEEESLRWRREWFRWS